MVRLMDEIACQLHGSSVQGRIAQKEAEWKREGDNGGRNREGRVKERQGLTIQARDRQAGWHEHAVCSIVSARRVTKGKA